MAASKAADTLIVLESGFKIIPGKEVDFLAFQARAVNLAMKQNGFRSTYGGPIMDSAWLYFGARFDSEEKMNAWHGERQHRAIQKSAPQWWTALYLRKWRVAAAGEAGGDRFMSESSICVDTEFDDAQMKTVRHALAQLGDAGAVRFETLTGQFESHPFQFVAPLGIAPAAGRVMYLLVVHWSCEDRFSAWKSSTSYSVLQSMGEVSSELFVSMEETRPRDNLREDRLQRDWEWTAAADR
jgi:antibiotic biosynthesis monooxygenase (ABM) superfamily enzyme